MQVMSKSFHSYPESAAEAVKVLKEEFDKTKANNTPSVKVKISCIFQDRMYCGAKVTQQIDCIFDHNAPEGYSEIFKGCVLGDYCEVTACTSTIAVEEMKHFETLMRDANIPVVDKMYSHSYFTIEYQGEKVKIPKALESHYRTPSCPPAPPAPEIPFINVQQKEEVKTPTPRVAEKNKDNDGLVLNFGHIRMVGSQYTSGGEVLHNVREMTPLDAATKEWLAKNG